MAVPKSKPETETSVEAPSAEIPQDDAALVAVNRRQTDHPSGKHFSPARALQSYLEAELVAPKAPSVSSPLITLLVLSLASSVVSLSLYSLGVV